jgi:hypothetical protein
MDNLLLAIGDKRDPNPKKTVLSTRCKNNNFLF